MEAEVAALRGELQAERSRSRNSDRDRDELREYLARQKDANAELTDEYNAAVVTADAEERNHGTVVRELQRKLQEATDFGRGERPAGRAELLANRRHIGSALRCRPLAVGPALSAPR